MKRANFMVVGKLIMQPIKMNTLMAKRHFFEMIFFWSLNISMACTAFDKSFHSTCANAV